MKEGKTSHTGTSEEASAHLAAPTSKTPFPWHIKSSEECLSELGLSDPNTSTSFFASGLTSAQASRRLEQYGENKLSEKEKVTLLQRIWAQVANVLVAILVFVAVVSAIRAVTCEDGQCVVTNTIQVGLIVFVIT